MLTLNKRVFHIVLSSLKFSKNLSSMPKFSEFFTFPKVACLAFACAFIFFSHTWSINWGTNDISGYDLTLSGAYEPFIQFPPFMAPLNGIFAKNILQPIFGPFAMEIYLALPLLFFFAYSIISGIQNPTDYYTKTRNLILAILSIPIVTINLHDMHSSIISTVFLSVIFYDAFISRKMSIAPALAFLFLISVFTSGNRINTSSFFFSLSLIFMIALWCSQKLSHDPTPSRRFLLGGLLSFSSIFILANVAVTLVGQSIYKEAIGSEFASKNAARHFVQVENTLDMQSTLKVLDLKDHETGLLNFSALPIEKYSGEWFKEAREKLKPLQINKTSFFDNTREKILALPGKAVVFWQTVFLVLLTLMPRPPITKRQSLFLLSLIVLPFFIAFAISYYFRPPPLRVWIPLLFSTNFILIICSLKMMEAPIMALKRNPPAKSIFGLKIAHFALYITSPAVADKKTTPLSFEKFAVTVGNYTIKFSRIYSSVFWKGERLKNFAPKIVFTVLLLLFVRGIWINGAHYNKLTNIDCQNNDEIWRSINTHGDSIFTFLDGIFYSPCLVRPYSWPKHQDTNIYPLGGTSFLSSSYRKQLEVEGGIEGLLCKENTALALRPKTKIDFQTNYPILSQRMSFTVIDGINTNIHIGKCITSDTGMPTTKKY